MERDLIHTRTTEGRSRAKARGQRMGRPPTLTPQQQKEAGRRRAEGATLKELVNGSAGTDFTTHASIVETLEVWQPRQADSSE